MFLIDFDSVDSIVEKTRNFDIDSINIIIDYYLDCLRSIKEGKIFIEENTYMYFR